MTVFFGRWNRLISTCAALIKDSQALTIFLAIGFLTLTACTPSTPIREFASKNAISLKYSAYDSVPTITAEAREMAAKHCAQYGKHANYKGGNAVNAFTTEETHQFACEDTKTDDSAIIAAQSQRPEYQAPLQTSCSTVGSFTNCYSY
jgi:hypothetical protein